MTLPDPETQPTLTVAEAAVLFDVSRTTAYDAIKRGTWPTDVVRIGNVVRIPTAHALHVLHLGDEVDPSEWSVTMGGTLIRDEEVA